jgi:hypothetical protein
MSGIRLKRTNLLNNDSLQATTALTGFRPVLGEIATGGDVRGTDRDRAAEALRDREVERTKAGSAAINLTWSVFGGRAGGARAMILVNLFKVKGITAMFCSLTHAKPESAATDVDVSGLADIRLEVKRESNGGGNVGNVGCGQDEPAATSFDPVTSSDHNRQPYFLKSRRMPGQSAVREFVPSSAPFSLREFHIGSEGIRIGSARVAQEAFRQARAGRGRGHGRKQSSTRMPFNSESKRHEQKSRGFAGL